MSIRPDQLPGASYNCSNMLIVAQRKVLKLKDPFDITFEGGKESQPLNEWYNNLPGNSYVQTLQLRKERERPFYHEFVVFRLQAGTSWRIDRRQQPDEQEPLNSIYRGGVTARDTIEEVRSFDDPLYPRSYCLIELEFKSPVHVGLILRVCRSIQNHAKLYTLQQHNCYFFAQALTICTACGVSDWAGMGKGETEGPWHSPNRPLSDFYKKNDLENKARLNAFEWNLDNIFTHDWGHLSRLSHPLIHSSPLLRHADHCNYCLESQSTHRQRSLSSEINRLKHELIDYWNITFRKVLNKAYLANHRRLVDSGVWEVVSMNIAHEDCKGVVQDNLDEVRTEWNEYSKKRVDKLITTVEDLLDPMEVCDAWYPDPDEWKSTWTCKDGGPVQAEMVKWRKEIRTFFDSEISHLEEELEAQTIEAGKNAQEVAMRTRLESFTESMTIKVLVAQHEGGLIVPKDAAGADQKSVTSRKTERSMKTMKTMKTMMTMHIVKFKNTMRYFFGKSHKMEEADVVKMKNQIEDLIKFHAARVENFKVLLNCGEEQVHRGMRDGIDQVWNGVIE
ncbi:hypothetical protein RSOLAG1IB_07750 [Rhizoctonia solani AG-1 IB]|uniref:Uncharacterized protein n=1 Tax=Thanatephorus cucumeris (strain AG1-IB / isolate 7/3/14) TaxID=1108050 RepID=A0A0B7FHC7_THACB|nr:hypothetical protein RSOLAG1IB_07750 [Rhizoctonia solani AG-1 IB]